MLDISEKLKFLRKQKRYTIQFVADSVGIAVRTYQNYEYGQREISVETLFKLADFYGVTTDYLLGREPQTDPLAMLNFNMGEDEIIREYMTLPANVRAIILDTMEMILDNEKNGKTKDKKLVYLKAIKHMMNSLYSEVEKIIYEEDG